MKTSQSNKEEKNTKTKKNVSKKIKDNTSQLTYTSIHLLHLYSTLTPLHKIIYKHTKQHYKKGKKQQTQHIETAYTSYYKHIYSS